MTTTNPDLVNMLFTNKLKPSPMVEFTVNPELKPFLITSSRSYLWREDAKREDNHYIVLSAVRPLKDNPQAEAIAAIIERSVSEEWGSVHPFSEEGFEACLDYLEDLGGEVDILVNAEDEVPFGEEYLTRTSWVPKRCAVFVPRDRRLLGDALVFEKTDLGSLCLFNVVLGVAFAIDV